MTENQYIFWCGGIDKYPLVARYMKKGWTSNRRRSFSTTLNFILAGIIEVATNFFVSVSRGKHWVLGARPVIIAVSKKEVGFLTLNLWMSKIKKFAFYPLQSIRIGTSDSSLHWLKYLGKDAEFVFVHYGNELIAVISPTDLDDIKKLKQHIEAIKRKT